MTGIRYHSSSDEMGRCRFSLRWMADYHPGDPRGEHRRAERGQYFFADPRNHGFPRPEEMRDSGGARRSACLREPVKRKPIRKIS